MMANREVINSILKEHMLTRILPDIFKEGNKELKKQGAYMVVVGGVSVEMCAQLDDTAQNFLKDVFSEDVDIKIVLQSDDANQELIHEVRMAYVRKMIRKLRSFVKRNKRKWDNTIDVKVILDETLLNHNLPTIRNARVVSVAVEYVESKKRITYPLIDTTFFDKSITPHFQIYKKVIKSQNIIPYYISNHVYYATCQYMMYDTCRMLIDRANYLKEKKTLFALMKFTKYVIKFMSLYVLRNQVKELPEELTKIYNDAHMTLLHINTIKLKQGFKNMKNIKYDHIYIDQAVSRLDTIIRSSNMKQLIKAIHSLEQYK